MKYPAEFERFWESSSARRKRQSYLTWCRNRKILPDRKLIDAKRAGRE